MPKRSSMRGGDRAVVRGRPAEQVAVRGAAHQHHGLDREREGRDMGLRHIGDQPRALADRCGPTRPRRRAAPRRRSARSRPSSVLSSVVLPPPFGPSSASTSPFASATSRPRPTTRSRIADGELAALEDHDQFLCTLASSQMKNGVPITAVRMPSGISTCASGARQRVDEQQIAAAEHRRGRQQPREIRADQRARQMRHHQPDPADDAGGRDARRGHQRRGGDDGDAQRPGGDAERARLLLRQRHHVHAPAQRDQHGGAERDRAEQRQEIVRRRWRRGCRAARTSSRAAGCRDRRDISRGRRRRRAASRSRRRSSTSTRIGSRERTADADRIDRADRDQPADEGERLDAEHAEREDRCRARRRAPRPTRRRECRATPADCGTGPGTRCRRPRARAPTSTAASTRGPRTCRITVSTAGGTRRAAARRSLATSTRDEIAERRPDSGRP